MSHELREVTLRDDPSPSVGELLRRLIEEIGDLFRAELRVARTEVTGNLASARGGAVAIAVGGIFFIGTLLAFLAAAIGWLAPHVGVGWAAFIVGVVSAILGGIFISIGSSKLKAVHLSPNRTIARLKKDAAALKGDD